MTPEEKEVVWRVLKSDEALNLGVEISHFKKMLKRRSASPTRSDKELIAIHREITRLETELNSLLDSL